MSRSGIVLGVCAGFCLFMAGCGGGGAAAGGSMAAVTEQSDLIAHVDHTGLLEAPIIKNLMAEQNKDEIDFLNMKPDAKAALEEVEKETGIHLLNDMKALTLAAKLTGVDLQNVEDPTQVPFVVGFDMTKDVSNEKILAAIKILAKDMLEAGGTVQAKDDLVYAEPPKDQDDPPVWGGGTGKAAFFGVDEALVKGAVGRAAAGGGAVPASLTAVKKSVPAGAQAWAAFAVPDTVREEIKKATADAGPQAGPLKPFEGLKSVALGVVAGTTLKVSLCADVGANDKAIEAKGAINTVLPSLAMFLPPLQKKMQGGGLAPQVDGTTVSLSIELTEEELSQSITPPGGGMAPPPGR